MRKPRLRRYRTAVHAERPLDILAPEVPAVRFYETVILAQRLRRCRGRCSPSSASLEGRPQARLRPSFEARKSARLRMTSE
jgi:hypothetical protein